MTFYIILVLLIFLWTARGVASNRKRRRPSRHIIDNEELAAKLQRIAAECTDGSVRIEEPERHMRAPDVTWTKVYDDPELFLLIYRDARGQETSRYIRLTRKGVRKDGVEIIEGYDGARLKTYRADRIVSLEDPGPNLLGKSKTTG